jgi:hypothetical protein
MELLEPVGPRPRQARYEAALRPDMKCFLMIRYLPTQMVLDSTQSACTEGTAALRQFCRPLSRLVSRLSPDSQLIQIKLTQFLPSIPLNDSTDGIIAHFYSRIRADSSR